MSNPDTSAHSRITIIWEKAAVWALSFIIVLLGLAYNDQKTKIEKMEERVQFLYIDKVNKSELKETEYRIMTRIEASQSDILARLDLYFGKFSDKK